MNIGAVFPHQEIGDDPVVIRDWAQSAEGLGYSHILAYDHVLGALHEGREPPLWGPYTESDSFHEIFVLFGFFAACTQRIGLTSGILILPQRQTTLVAKQTAEVDVLSGGRLRLGVGTGWNYVEYDSLNESFSDRGIRQEEQVEVLRLLWSEQLVDYRGKFHKIDRAGLNPLPKRKIPIWFGGFAPVAFRRAVSIGDGFIYGGGHDDNLQAHQAVVSELDRQDRNADGFGHEAILNYQSGPRDWEKEARAWSDLGADYVSMRAQALRGQGDGLASPQEHIDALSTYWDAVGGLSDAD
ncbi:MAG: LLM class F420-dependent oxidoreductase [Pseudomonadales bacterium]